MSYIIAGAIFMSITRGLFCTVKIVTATNIFFSVVSVMKVMSVGGFITGLNSLYGH